MEPSELLIETLKLFCQVFLYLPTIFVLSGLSHFFVLLADGCLHAAQYLAHLIPLFREAVAPYIL